MSRNTLPMPVVLHGDAPITRPEEDRLSRTALATHLAQELRRVPAANGFVYAIQGPWGSGKSSVLNLLELELKKPTSSDARVLVVRFDPWWFSGDDLILREFLNELGSAVAESGFWRFGDQLGHAIQNLGKLTAPAWEVVVPGPAGKKVAEFQKSLSTERTPTITALRDRIVQRLRDHDTRIVVFLDELDRLLPSELQSIFRLIKSVARFPNVVYVPAYDRDRTIALLNQQLHGDGEGFLEKIIQSTLDLPEASRSELETLFVDDLNALLSSTPTELWNITEWQNLYLGAIRQLLRSPRDVSRFVNGIAGTYPAVRTEVRATDFLGLQALRVFASWIYDAIQARPGLFTSPERADRTILDELFSRASEELRKPLTILVGLLFPRVRGLYDNTTYGSEWDSVWRRERRIASSAITPVFFRLSVPI